MIFIIDVVIKNNMNISCRWHNGEIYVVVINFKDQSYTIDLTYFENVTGQLKTVVRSIQSPKNAG